MTLKQFNDQYPDFDGLLFINSNFFLDGKLKEQLDELNVKYLELNLMVLESSFLRWYQPEIGINLAYVKNGEVIDRFMVLGTQKKLITFINNLNKEQD